MIGAASLSAELLRIVTSTVEHPSQPENGRRLSDSPVPQRRLISAIVTHPHTAFEASASSEDLDSLTSLFHKAPASQTQACRCFPISTLEDATRGRDDHQAAFRPGVCPILLWIRDDAREGLRSRVLGPDVQRHLDNLVLT